MKRVLVGGLLVIAAAVLIWHSLFFNFVTDDAFISFVYSRNLVRHGQLVFNLGERVEGYTNFLWTVLLAFFLRIGLQPEIMSRVLGTLFGVATFGTCAFLSKSIRTGRLGEPSGARRGSSEAPRMPESIDWWDAVPALFLAAVPGYACWSSGGLETQMFTFFVTLAMALYLTNRSLGSAIAFGLAALTRPEGVLFFGLTGLYHLIRKRRFGRDEIISIAAFALLVVPHFLFRRFYYGYWLPNTFYIKSSGTSWEQGFYYLKRFSQDYHLWAFVAAAILSRQLRGYLFFVGFAFCIYVASVGGDFMGLYRFALPILPLLFVVAADGIRPLAERLPLPQLVIALLLVGQGWHAYKVTQHATHFIGADRGIDTPGYLRWYTADRAAIGKWFGARAQPDDYAAVGGAGAQVWYSGMRSLDCFGLSDAYIAHKVPPVSNRPGHQKYAPDSYIVSRNPTIVTSHNYNIAGVPNACSDAPAWKQRGYRCVSARVPGLSSPIYSFLLRNDRQMPGLIDDHPPAAPTEEREP